MWLAKEKEEKEEKEMSLIEKMREIVKNNPQLSMALEEGIAYGRKKKAEREGRTELDNGETLNLPSKNE